ncbi:MAG TPA: hypothetical protein VGD41_03550 [Pyrinomonadaceae bacterium]
MREELKGVVSNRYVAMIDILGFARLVETSPLMEIVKKTEMILRRWPESIYLAWVVINDDGSLGPGYSSSFGRAYFSDTLILWTRPIDETFEYRYQEECCFFQTVGQIICTGFLNGMPLRPGIGFGECYIDETKRTYLGRAIVNAYKVEKIQEWIGGALHPNCPAVEQMNQGEAYLDCVVKYSVPVKAGSEFNLEFALDWTVLAQAKGPWSQSYRDNIERRFLNYLGLGLPPDGGSKYKNARTFAEQQIAKGLASGKFTAWNPANDSSE